MNPLDSLQLTDEELAKWAREVAFPALQKYAAPNNWVSKHGNGGGVDDSFTPMEDCEDWTHGKFARDALRNLYHAAEKKHEPRS